MNTEYNDQEDLFDIIDNGRDYENNEVKENDSEGNEEESVKEDEEDDLFNIIDKQRSENSESLEEDETQNDDEDSEEDYVDERSVVLNYLIEKGIADEDDVDISDYSDDDMDVYISDKMESFFDKRMKETFEGLPDIVRQINEYAIAGGDITAFFNQIASNNQINPNNINIEEPSHQEYIIASTLQKQGYPQDFIKSQIDFLKQSNNLDVHAKAYFNQYQQAQLQEREELIKQQQEIEKQKEISNRNLRKRVSELSSQDVIGEYTLSLRDKKELTDYLTTPAYTLDNKETITEFQKDLFYEISKNETTMLQLALLLKNRNEDGSFNFSGIKKKTITEVTNKIRNNVRRVNKKPSSYSNKNTVPSYKNKSLAEYL